MKDSLKKLIAGYHTFKEKYAQGSSSVMHTLSDLGQTPQAMVVACCDSRVDPALILQADPGDLFVVRNVASIVPPYEPDKSYHGTSAALEFGVRFLKVKHLILLGHSQCGGIDSLIHHIDDQQTDFISQWMSIVKTKGPGPSCNSEYVKHALQCSYQNCLAFPWIKERIIKKELSIHVWFFEIKTGQVFFYDSALETYLPLEKMEPPFSFSS